MNNYILSILLYLSSIQFLFAQTNCRVDTLPPEIQCLDNIQLILDESDTRIFALDFNLGATDNCTESHDDLTYSFSPDSVLSTYSFQIVWPCDIQNPSIRDSSLIDHNYIRTYVSDNNGNISSCKTKISDLSFSRNGCSSGINDITFQLYDVKRNLTFERDLSISARRTNLFNGNIEKSFIENAERYNRGFYYHPKFASKFEFLESIESIFVFLDFEAITNDFITASDLIIVQNHILGLNVFTEDWQFIAADINSDKQVNIFDLLILRNVILGQSIPADIPSHKISQFKTNALNAFEYFNVADSQLAGQTLRFTLIRNGDLNNQ